MTVITFLAIPSGMHITESVTFNAFSRGSHIAFPCVAAITGHVFMLAAQHVIRIVVIKYLLLPTLIVVTVLAFLPEIALVNVIVNVTAVTGGRCIPEFFALLVA